MPETNVLDRPEVKPQFMTVKPQEGGSPIMLYTANYSSGVLAHDVASIESPVKVSYASAPIYVGVRREKGQLVGSYYVSIVDAPGQPELVGKVGWLYRLEQKKGNGEVEKQWSTAKFSA